MFGDGVGVSKTGWSLLKQSINFRRSLNLHGNSKSHHSLKPSWGISEIGGAQKVDDL